MSDAPLLEVRGLECGYGGKTVLHGIDLVVNAGDRVVLLGPNGSGKSTLLRAIGGLVRPTAGEILLQGVSIRDLSVNEIAKRVASVPQEEPAQFHFLVREVVTMGRLARSNSLFDTEEDRDAASDAMNRSDCFHLKDRPFTELSGGEHQRVLIARAIAQQTPLVLLDEPTSHLDPAHQLSIAELIGSLSGAGTGTVAAVHDLNFASRVANRALLLDQGKVANDGSVEEVLMSPILDAVYGVKFYRSPARPDFCVFVGA